MTVVRKPKYDHRKGNNVRRKRGVMMFVSDEELATLDKHAQAFGMPRATYMRWRLLYGGRKATEVA